MMLKVSFFLQSGQLSAILLLQLFSAKNENQVCFVHNSQEITKYYKLPVPINRTS